MSSKNQQPILWEVPRNRLQPVSSYGKEVLLRYPFPTDELPLEAGRRVGRGNWCFEVSLKLIEEKGADWELSLVAARLSLLREKTSAPLGASFSERWKTLWGRSALIFPYGKKRVWSYESGNVRTIRTQHFRDLRWLFTQSADGSIAPAHLDDLLLNSVRPSLLLPRRRGRPKLRLVLDIPKSDNTLILGEDQARPTLLKVKKTAP